MAGLLVVAVAAAAWFLSPRAPVPPSPLAAAVEAPPAPPPPPPWTVAQLDDLLVAAERAGREGLRSADYDVANLRRAVEARRTGPETDAMADAAAAALAHDFAAGRIRNRHRFNWHIDYVGPDAAARARDVVAARRDGRLSDWLTGLLPDAPAYRRLRAALADTSADDVARRDRIRANMERWRWLPRGFGGGDRLYVNLPTYRLEVQRDGETVSTYKAVIGATDMPTPALSAAVRQVIVNPDWIVPPSIVRKSHLRPGVSSRYIFTTRPDGTLRVRQKPGAGNALGKVKIEFPNPLAIYFHDTPARSLFGQSVRTFSHGCVRVQDIDRLAAAIVPRPDRYAEAMAGAKTRSFPMSTPWRADIVYLTLVPDEDDGLVDVGDPYALDAKLAAALDGRKPAPKIPAPTPEPSARPVVPTEPAPPPPAPASPPPPPPQPEDAPAPLNLLAPAAPPARPGTPG